MSAARILRERVAALIQQSVRDDTARFGLLPMVVHGGGIFEIEELRRGPTIPAGRRGSSAARLPGPIPGQQGRHRNYCAICWRWYSLRFMSR